jgi:predicted RNase H-like HicB family nuclease/uncharacterized damage-inducible protein DinB
MDEPVTYDAYLEVERDGRWVARILDLPGCQADGMSEQEALAALTAAIPAYYAWLKRHDDYTPDVRGPWAVIPRETVRSATAGAFFTPDAQPVDEGELDWGMALLEWAYEDLLGLANRLPAAALDIAPAGGGWTIRQVLLHLARGQFWYLSHLAADPAPLAPPRPGVDTLEEVGQARAVALSQLRNANEETCVAIRDHGGERWSMRKVLRQSVGHMREHTAQIERALAGMGYAAQP